MDNLNNELEDVVANDMAYEFSKIMILGNEESRKMAEIAQRYGLNEKQSVLMLMEFSNLGLEND